MSDGAPNIENKETAPVSGTEGQGGGAGAAAAPASAAPAESSPPAAPASGSDAPVAPAEGKPGDAAPPADGAKPAEAKPAAAEPYAFDQAKVVEELIKGLSPEQQEKAREHAKTRPLMEIFRGSLAAQSKITELTEKAKGLVKIPGKDAKPEEIAEYHKAIGVPETADKYELKAPDGLELDETASTMAKTAFKDLGISQAQANGLLELQVKAEAAKAEATTKMINAAAETAQNDLRVHFGSEYAPKIEMMNRYVEEMSKRYGPEFATVFNQRFNNGLAGGETPAFVKWFDEHVVSNWAADNGIPRGIDSGGGVSDEQRKAEILRMAHGTEAERKDYESERYQNELKAIIARQQRKANRAA